MRLFCVVGRALALFLLAHGLSISEGIAASKPHPGYGSYQGVLIKYVSTHLIRQPVTLQLTSSSKESAEMEVRDLHNTLLESARLSWGGRGYLQIEFPHLGSFSLKRTKVEKGKDGLKCYAGEQKFSVDVCINEQKLVMHVAHRKTHASVFSLSGEFTPEAPKFVMETPADYMISEVVRIAQSRSFDSRIEFEHVIQAKQSLGVTAANLAPHVNYKGVSTLVGLSPLSIAVFVGQFTPFLLPSRWMQLREARDQNKVEQITQALVQADLTVTAEDLAYVLERDTHHVLLYQQMLERAVELRNSLSSPSVKLEKKFDTLISLLRFDLIQVESVVKADRRAFSEVLGFHNPEAVQSVLLGDEEVPLENAREMTNGDDIAQSAVSRSLEWVQLRYLIDVAQTQKKEFYFNWMDGEIDSKAALGFGVGESMALCRSRVDELVVKQEKTRTDIYDKTIEVIENHNLAVRSYPFVKEELDEQWENLNTLSQNLRSAEDSQKECLDIKGTFYSYIASKIKMEGLIANYRTLRSKLDRMLLKEYYAQFFSE